MKILVVVLAVLTAHYASTFVLTKHHGHQQPHDGHHQPQCPPQCPPQDPPHYPPHYPPQYHHHQHQHQHQHHEDHDDYHHHPYSKLKLVHHAFWDYVAKETDSDDCHDNIKRCHLKEKFNSIIEKSTEAINKFLHFLHTKVASVTMVFLQKLHHEVDHLKAHLDDYMNSLKHHLHFHNKHLEHELHCKVDEMKTAADHHVSHLDINGLKTALMEKISEIKDSLAMKGSHMHYLHPVPYVHDMTKELENGLDSCQNHLNFLTNDFGHKLNYYSHKLFSAHKVHKPILKHKPSFSCKELNTKIEDLWESFCNLYSK